MSNGKIILCFFLFFVILGIILNVQKQSLINAYKNIDWEYQVVSVNDSSFEEEMNSYGRKRWEIIFARRASSGSDSYPIFRYEMILKRPRL